jgi:flagellar motor switch protein FliG
MSQAAATTLPAVPGAQLPVPAKTPVPPMTAVQKAAIILTAMGPELAQVVLKDVAPQHLKRFVAATTALPPVTNQMLDAVIVEFLEVLSAGVDLAGGADAARRLLAGVLEEEQIQDLLDGTPGRTNVWDRLNTAPVMAVASYIGNEHPQTAAVILSELKSEVAASILERLNQSFAREVVLRLSRVPTIDRRASNAVAAAIERDFLSALQRSMNKRRPADLIAGLMNNISSDSREGFLSHLEEKVPELAVDVQRSMFTFDHIATRMSGRDVGSIVRDLPEEVLLPALKWGQMQRSESVEFILQNIPRRLSERYAEELSQMEDVSRKEGEASHIEITKLVLARQKAGTITLLDKEEG